MKLKGTITPETYDHRVYTLEDIEKHEFTDDELLHINAAIDDHNTRAVIEPLDAALHGLLQKLQTDLNMHDLVASKMIITVRNTPIDELHRDFDMNSFYAGAAWYSRELAKACYEYIEENKVGGQNESNGLEK